MPHAAVSPYEAGAWENPSWWWSEVKKGPPCIILMAPAALDLPRSFSRAIDLG